MELTREVVRNEEEKCAIEMMLIFTMISVEFLTWGDCLVPAWKRAALIALCQSNAFFVSSRQTYIIVSVTSG